MCPNLATAGNGAITRPFQTQTLWRAVPERQRWRPHPMWFITSAASGLVATAVMFVLCFAIGSAPMAPGHTDYSFMYFVIISAALLSAFLTRRRSWPVAMLGAVVFSIPVLLFSLSRYHDFSVADPLRWSGEARQWKGITQLSPLFPLISSVIFAIANRQPPASHEQQNA